MDTDKKKSGSTTDAMPNGGVSDEYGIDRSVNISDKSPKNDDDALEGIVTRVVDEKLSIWNNNIASMQNHGGLLFVTIRRAHKNAFQEEHFSKKAVQKPYSDVLFSDDAVAFPSLLYQDRGAKTDFSLP